VQEDLAGPENTTLCVTKYKLDKFLGKQVTRCFKFKLHIIPPSTKWIACTRSLRMQTIYSVGISELAFWPDCMQLKCHQMEDPKHTFRSMIVREYIFFSWRNGTEPCMHEYAVWRHLTIEWPLLLAAKHQVQGSSA